MKVIILTALALALALPATADVYKWVDSSGKVHYSDKPEQIGTERLKVRTARTDYQRLENDRQQALDSAQQEAEAAAKRAEAEEKQAEADRLNRENCEKARRNLNRLASAQRLYEVDAAGERTYLTDAEIDSRRQSARDDVARYCNE